MRSCWQGSSRETIKALTGAYENSWSSSRCHTPSEVSFRDKHEGCGQQLTAFGKSPDANTVSLLLSTLALSDRIYSL